IASCGGKETPPPAEEAPVVEVVDTVKPEVPPPPPKPEPTMDEIQQSLRTIYFDFDKFNLRPDAKADLDKNYEILQEYPNVMVQIQGHCDERGTVEYNLALGEKRASAAKDYLVGMGINPDRLSTISYGEERPANPGHNEAAWAQNRRDEFKIVSM
ncbi:MAG: peptidoglycan-associated lipoprotein Pal, partial [Candidatus Zixiibacteriota bacterium]